MAEKLARALLPAERQRMATRRLARGDAGGLVVVAQHARPLSPIASSGPGAGKAATGAPLAIASSTTPKARSARERLAAARPHPHPDEFAPRQIVADRRRRR